MDLNTFNRQSVRSKKARIGVRLNKTFIYIFYVFAFMLLATGIVLLALLLPIGWTLIGFTAVPLMIIEWKKGELEDLEPKKNPKSVDDVLSVDMLGLL